MSVKAGLFLLGMGAGAVIGYVVPSVLGGPKVTASPSIARVGQQVMVSYRGFPPNTLLRMFVSTAGAPMEVGTTDVNGSLDITQTVTEANVYAVLVWANTNPLICAKYTLTVNP